MYVPSLPNPPPNLPPHPPLCMPSCFYPTLDSLSFSDYTIFIKFAGIISLNNFLLTSLSEISTTIMFSSIQLFSHVRLLCDPMDYSIQASLSFTISRSLLKLISVESVMSSNHLILCCPLFLLPSIFPSIRVFSNESVLRIRWSKYWRFSFSISSSNE